jgi:glycosyltransferase involved in cell wall biosynthesis
MTNTNLRRRTIICSPLTTNQQPKNQPKQGHHAARSPAFVRARPRWAKAVAHGRVAACACCVDTWWRVRDAGAREDQTGRRCGFPESSRTRRRHPHAAEHVKVLIVTMYASPAAGAGAQRPANLVTHLPTLGTEVHVLAPDDPKWVQRDEPPLAPLDAVRVHRVRNHGPRSRLRGREIAGVGIWQRLAAELALLPRRLLIPDPEVLWAVAAARAAVRLIEQFGIEVVLTSSPPISLHLVGAVTRRLTRVRWVADLRDPIVASPFRRAEIRGESHVARLVARRADAITTATRGAADEIRMLGRSGGVMVVPNGCDSGDFDGLGYQRGERFRITHTGSFHSPHRDPRPFFAALRESGLDAVARFVGDLRPSDRIYANELGLSDRVEVMPFVPRRHALALQRDSDALLLLIPEARGRGRGVVTAKLCEYVAARRPILAVIPTDGEAADLLRLTAAASIVGPGDVDGMTKAIVALEHQWREGTLGVPPLAPAVEASLSGRAVAEAMASVVDSLQRTAPR